MQENAAPDLKPRRIAICGSAPSSVHLAPIGNPEWEIWGCSPGCAQHHKWDAARFNAWFEIHRWDEAKPDLDAEYIAFLKAIPGPVYTIRPVPGLSNSVAYPLAEMIRMFIPTKFGLSFLASTVSYMLMKAMADVPAAISCFGIDMAAASEYATQKPGCHYFFEKAELMGIKIDAPAESDLLIPLPPYGYSEDWPMARKLAARKAELETRHANKRGEHNHHATLANQAGDVMKMLDGAIDDLNYQTNTWLWDADFERMVTEAQRR